MTKAILLVATLIGFSFAHANDFSGSQDHLVNSGRANTSNGTKYETSPNDLSNSQDELRRNGRARRTVYMSCLEAEYGSEFYWECKTVNQGN